MTTLTDQELRNLLQALVFAAADIRYRNRTPPGAKVEATLDAAIADQLTPAHVQWLAASDIIIKPVKAVVPDAEIQFIVAVEGSFVIERSDVIDLTATHSAAS